MALTFIEEWCSDLDKAVENGNTESISSLLSQITINDENINNDDADTKPLRFAVATGDQGIINMVYQSLGLVRRMTAKDMARMLIRARCPFPHAVSLGDLDVAKFMLESGADVNERVAEGFSALHRAVASNDSEQVEFLLHHSADVDARTHGLENTPLHVLCTSSRSGLELARLLVTSGADANARNRLGETPLHCAIRHQDVRIVRFLAEEAGGDMLARNEARENALHLATSSFYPDVVDYALDSYADLNATDRCGETPLHLAARRGSFGVVKRLLRRGADCELRDALGRTPLRRAMAFEKCAEVARLFFEAGADVLGSHDGNEILMEAQQSPSTWLEDVVAQIAKLGAMGKTAGGRNMRLIERDPESSALYARCTQELARMMKRKFYEDVTVFDILTAKLDRISHYARNDELVSAFHSSDCCGEFPIYGEYATGRFEDEIEKQELMQNTAVVLSDLLIFDYQDHVAMEKILSYLSESDMRKITNVCL